MFQYGFKAGVSTKTALHEFVRRIELSLAKKRTALEIFLDIVGAFDNITHKGIADALRELEVSHLLVHWIENLLRHRTVQVELNGEKIKREVVKKNPQGGILYKHFLRVKRDKIQLFKRVKTSKSTSLGLHKIAKS